LAKQSSLSQQKSELAANKAELDRIYSITTGLNEAQLERGVLLEKENAALQKNIDALEVVSKTIKDQNKFLDKTETLQGSIADKVGKSHKLYKESQKYIERQRQGLSDIANFTQTIGDAQLAAKAQAAADAYKQYQKTVASVADRTSFTGKRQEEANVLIAKARAEYDQSVSSLKEMGENGQFILDKLNSMADETDKFGNAVTKTTEEWKAMDALLGSFSGIPAMSEFNTLLKTNIRDTLAWKAAVFALGAALGKAAYDYFGAPIKAAMQADKERAQNQIDVNRDVAKLQSDSQFIPSKIAEERVKNEIDGAETIRKLNIDAQFASQKAAISFSAQMQQGAAQFQRAAKTALFGKGIGSVGYGAAQMQLAGIGAEKVASAMEAAGSATGKMPSAKVGADMAIMAERTGASVDNIASINEMFQRIDGASESSAMNMQEGLRAMADQAGIGLGELTKEMAEASKEMLGYQIKSGPALAKQVAYAKSIGVSFNDIAKAGKSMVLNYKDSIKSEMSLSAMLGKNVNLSEVRAKFMSGDQEGAMQALKAQGLDPESMNMFQQEELSKALGGMDLSSISKISKNTGKDVDLKGGNAKAGNKDFLSRTQSAEAALNSQNASISARTAILDAQLSKTIGDAYLADPGYAKYLQAQNTAEQQSALLAASMEDAWKATDAYQKSLSDSAQLDFVSGLKENLMGGLAAVAGGIGTSLIDRMIPKSLGGIGDKIKGIFSFGGGGGGGDDASSPSSPSDAPSGPSATEGPIADVASQIEAAAPVLEKSKSLGQNLRDFGKGIGSFLSSVGKGAGTAIQGLMTGIANGLKAFGKGSVEILLGAATIAGVIVAIGAGIAGASWIMGKALPTLAEGMMSFNKIDGGNLARVGIGLTAMGIGLSALGVGSVLSAVGGWLGKKMGGGLEETVKKMQQFASVKINHQNVKDNALSVVAYSKAMMMMGAGSAISGLGNLAGGIANAISGFFEVKPPLQQMEEFAKLKIGDTANLKKNAEAFVIFGQAMASFQGSSGSFSGVLGDVVAKFFKLEPPLEQMKKFASADIGDVSKLETNAKAFTIFGNAMASFKGMNGGLMSVLATGLSKFFGLEPPFKEMQKFAAVTGIDVARTKNNAEAFTAFGNAMASYSGTGTGFWSSLGKGMLSFFGGGDGDLLQKFREFAALNSGGMLSSAKAIGVFNTNLSNFKSETATKVSEGMTSVSNAAGEYLTSDRIDSINAFASSIGALNSQLTILGGIASMINSAADAIFSLANAFGSLGSIDTKKLTEIPWSSMEDFASEGGKFVLANSGGGSFALSKQTTTNIDKMSKKTEESFKELKFNSDIQNKMVAILVGNLAALQQIAENTAGETKINLDGRKVNKTLLASLQSGYGISRT
jgi:hypothetical protein